MSIILLLVAIFAMMFAGFPIVFSIGASSLGFLILNGIPLAIAGQVIVNYLNEFVLIAIPLFILAAQLMNSGGMTDRIIAFLRCFFGPLRGGLAHVNIVASMVFAGVSGAQVADASSVGTVMVKVMTDDGYDIDYAAAVSAASSTIGPIIPPSVPMVVAGAMAGLSVTRLFLAGVVPGVLMGVGMMLVAGVIAAIKNHPKHAAVPVSEFLRTFRAGFIDLLLPLVVIGGIVFGVFTPTEAAAVAVFGSIFVGGIVHHEITIRKFVRCAYETVMVTAEVLLIAAVCVVLTWILVYEQVPQSLLSLLVRIDFAPAVLLFLVNLILILLGMLVAGMPTLLIAIPLLLPIVGILGIDQYHFTALIVLVTMMGGLTPPVGTLLFIMSSVAKRPIGAIVKAMLPFYGVLFVVILLVTYVPQLTTWLPKVVLP
jgi:C4-dicarboxylate transporter, DctM subunit